MKNKFNLPNYRIRKQSGPVHAQRFQVRVFISRLINEHLLLGRSRNQWSVVHRR